MKNHRNRQVILKSRPADIPQAADFEIIQPDVPDIRDGQMLVHNIYLSVEPAMRGWVKPSAASPFLRIEEAAKLRPASQSYRPANTGLRFSWKALIPSRASAVLDMAARVCASSSSWLSSERFEACRNRRLMPP
jgi:hypothetical protein